MNRPSPFTYFMGNPISLIGVWLLTAALAYQWYANGGPGILPIITGLAAISASNAYQRIDTVKIAAGERTSLIGVMEGTFTKPMPVAGGKPIAPTGKSFKLIMCTVGHWKNGVMDEEYLFWDNATFMQQLGIGK